MIKKKLYNRIKSSGKGDHSKIYSSLFALLLYPFFFSTIRKEYGEHKRHSVINRNLFYLAFDYLYTSFYYSISLEEPTYFALSLYNKSKAERDTFILKDYKMVYAKIDTSETRKVTADKYTSYEVFYKFYKRKMIRVSLPQDNDAVGEFANVYHKIILKPESGKKGSGVCVYEESEDIKFDEFIKTVPFGHYVVEEFIEQNEFMKSFHSSSVNTIRFVTCRNGKKVHNIYAMLRMGVGGNCVDNASAGGLCASVNIETGLITSEGKRRNGEKYVRHPDTNVLIKGNTIPCWNDLLTTVNEIMETVPMVKYVGWDFALTKKGWCIIEGNNKPSFLGIQMCENKGLLYKLNKYLDLI